MTSRHLTTPNKYAGLGATTTADLMIGFWFGVGVMLAVGVVNSLNYFVRAIMRGNKVTASKMTEQVQQVTMKDPKKVKAGKRLAEYNHRKREQMKAQKSESETKLTYYVAGTVVAVGVLGVIGYYVYQSKTSKVTLVNETKKSPVH